VNYIKGENLMKHLNLSIIGLILLTLTPLAFADPTLFVQAVKQSLATLDNLQIKGDLDDIKKRQLIDLMGDMRGVITTLSETSNFTESSRQGRVYENSLIPLSQSLDKSYSLAQMFLEDSKVTAATPLISIYGQLATLKKQVLVELGQISVADSFQQDADQKQSSLQEAKKEVCEKILSIAGTGTAIGIGGGCGFGAGVGAASGVGIFSPFTAAVGCVVGAVVGGIGGVIVEEVATDNSVQEEECKKQ
jgi:hypothetical protein